MTGFDYVVIGIVSVSLLFGLWRGVIGEVIALVAWGVGIFAAIEFGAPGRACRLRGLERSRLEDLGRLRGDFRRHTGLDGGIEHGGPQHGQSLGALRVGSHSGHAFRAGPWCAGVYGARRVGRYDLRTDAVVVEKRHAGGATGNRRYGSQTVAA